MLSTSPSERTVYPTTGTVSTIIVRYTECKVGKINQLQLIPYLLPLINLTQEKYGELRMPRRATNQIDI